MLVSISPPEAAVLMVVDPSNSRYDIQCLLSKKEDEESFKVKRGKGVAPTSSSFGTTVERKEVSVTETDRNLVLRTV
jgi:hypothetical protein